MEGQPSRITAAASRLWKAAETKITCSPIRDLIGPEDVSTAYQVQLINTNLKLQHGARLVGKKIGLTSNAVQQQLGVNQPDFGILFNNMQIADADELPWDQLMQPKVEAEVAFVLGKDLDGADLSTDDLVDAIDYLVPSLEIVGSRIANWDITITDTIADNASASHFVLGRNQIQLSDMDLVGCKMTMFRNGSQVSSGTGAACLGSPLTAVLWLAQTMTKLDMPLKKGEIILSGALGAMADVEQGDLLSAEITGLGEVSVRFGK